VTAPTGPPGPPDPQPAPGAARRPVAPFLLGAAAGAAVLLAGIGVGFVVWGDDEAEPVTTVASTVEDEAPDDRSGGEDEPTDPFGGDLSDLPSEDLSDLFDDFSDMFGGDLSDFLPDDLGDFDDMFSDGFAVGELQAVALLDPDATRAQVDRVDEAWSESPLLSSVLVLDPDDLPMDPSLPGALQASVTGFAQEEDAEEVRAFVCGFADDPGVASVQLLGPGTRPCDQSL
jgi:hypothetical protein